MHEANRIKQCSIILTRNCNLRCNFCFAKGAGYCENEQIEIDSLKKIIDFCCELEVEYVFFTGGEPLLYPSLNEALAYLKKKNKMIKTAIASNGILMENRLFCEKLFDSGLDYIDISIKGKNTEEWIAATGYDGYILQQKAIRNLSLLNVDFTCSMVVSINNVYSICDSVEEVIKSGGKQFSFTFFIDNSRNQRNGVDYLATNNPFELIEAFISQIDRLDTITKEWWIEYSFPICMFTKKQLQILEGKLATPCQVHKKNAITFDTQLNLLPCDMYYDEKIGKLGEDFSNAKEFMMFCNKDVYEKTMSSISRLPSDKCVKCEFLEKCFGGCPVLWRNYSFSEMEKCRDSSKENK